MSTNLKTKCLVKYNLKLKADSASKTSCHLQLPNIVLLTNKDIRNTPKPYNGFDLVLSTVKPLVPYLWKINLVSESASAQYNSKPDST